jgi:hypothetical protein
MTRRPLRLPGLAAALLLGWPAIALADPVSANLPAEQLHFAVLRNGEPIGTDEMDVFRQGDRLTILSRADVAVTILGITAFRFTSRCDEEWADGRLASFEAHTNYNGRRHEVMVEPQGDGLWVTENGVRKLFPAVSLVGTLWSPDTIRQSRLIDPVNGKLRAVSVIDRGLETLEVRGRPLQAHHYSMTGALRREIWYGPDGHIVHLEFEAGDGSLISANLL